MKFKKNPSKFLLNKRFELELVCESAVNVVKHRYFKGKSDTLKSGQKNLSNPI